MDVRTTRGMDVALVSVSMKFGDFTAVQPSDLTINAGEFFSILGPSGCGKTTILRIVSGFLRPSSGTVMIGGEDMTNLGPNKRPTALIFQNLALFPLMKVWENVAFGLEARRVPKAERRKRAEELLELVALTGQGDKRPTELSGGQRQRVAVARGLAVEPSVLLLDEPLSSLDLKLRQHMRAELRSIQRKTGVTFVYITHDQGEALTMSDRIAVMNQGRFEQVARTEDLYDNPVTPFVATFLGEQNVFQGTVVASAGGEARVETPLGAFTGLNRDNLRPGDSAMLFVRAERMAFAKGAMTGGNRLTARIERRDLEGPFINLFMRAGGNQALIMHLTNSGEEWRSMEGEVDVAFSTGDAIVLRAGELASE